MIFCIYAIGGRRGSDQYPMTKQGTFRAQGGGVQAEIEQVGLECLQDNAIKE
jgi:hypothetical protein